VCFRDIIRGNPNIKWESIKGLENAKKLLKEAVVMPIKYPTYVIYAILANVDTFQFILVLESQLLMSGTLMVY
jgi:SpoVK/Ycf46/Vps4 family AAA+-type ATPase